MANLRETATWEAGIYQWETSDPVMGGENGIDNKPTRQLANRTQWLKTELAKAVQSIGMNLQTAEQKYALKTTTLTAGAGLIGGGVLRDNMALSLGTPSKITATTTNSAVSNTHTHEVDKASTTVMGIVKLSSATNSDAENLAATPKAIKTVLDTLTNLDGRSFKQYGALSNRNLNDLKGDTNYGVWHQTANAAATAERNYPTIKAGTLYVLPSAYSGQQIYYPLDQNVFYKRHSLPDGNWSTWHTMCEVIDSPSSTSTTAAASANQVKRLNDRAANIERTKLGNTGNQTISNGGLIVGDPTVWFKTTYPSGNGRWMFETHPQSSASTPNSIRFNYKFEEDGQPVKYLSFPDIGSGQTVAYQSWVNSLIKFARPAVKSGNAEINLDLTNRAQIIAELGNDFIANGVNQLVIHNTGTQHNVTHLPLPNKSPIQLDICLMGGYSYIDCHYILLNRSFRTSVNWNNETLVLNWKENINQNNGVMLSGNQTIDGHKIFNLVEIRNELAVGNRAQESNAYIDFYAKGTSSGDYTARIINPIGTQRLELYAAGGVKIASIFQAIAPAADANNDQVPTTAWAKNVLAAKNVTITAGNGLTGGGDLSANRTFSLGTPSQITAASTNAVTATSHTHAIDKASTAVAGIVQLNSATNSDAENLAATPKAVKAAFDRAAQSAPSGVVAFFAGANAPVGWLKANGAAVSRTTYAALFATIGTTFGAGDGSTTFNLPDLRGEFIRGFDDGRNVDAGRGLGSWQGDAYRSHRHREFASTEFSAGGAESWANQASNAGLVHLGRSYYTSWEGGNETRPRNIALLACIKI